MVDSLPAWSAAPMAAIGLVWVLYRVYIRPGYYRDREERKAA